MRLLQLQGNGELSLVERVGDNIPPYAILSHTWGPSHEEVTYVDLLNGTGKTKNGYRKLTFCGEQAAEDGLQYFWVDTACIDKTSSAELSEAINSMYLWYQAADVCYAYLADVTSQSSFSGSKWFTRGWTLQELLAPASVVFYDESWNLLGTKADLCQAVSECTRIPMEMLSGDQDLDTFSIAQRMSWAAKRNTSRIEDQAYCLMGIFDINMPLIYGEGENAFIRLQEEIIKISDDHSIFAWRSTDDRSGCLATSPASFYSSWNIVQRKHVSMSHEPVIASSRGMHLDLRFIGMGYVWHGFVILNCCERGREEACIGIYLRDLTMTMQRFKRVWSEELAQFDLQMFDPSKYLMKRVCIEKGRIARKRGAGVPIGVNLPHFNPAGFMEILTDRKEYDSLIQAVKSQNHDNDVWTLLTKRDPEVNATDSQGRSALSHAAMSCKLTSLNMLINRNDVHLDHKDNSGRSPLSLAAENGYVGVASMLLDTGKVNVNAKDHHQGTPLSWAAANGQEMMVSFLLSTGKVQVDSNGNIGETGETPLMRATENGHEEVVQLLLSTGKVRVDVKRHGMTPLLCAAQNGHERVVKLLLSIDMVDVDATDSTGKNALCLAAKNGHEAIVRLLVGVSSHVDGRDNYGGTPLLYAASGGHEAVVKLLLRTGMVDVEARNHKGQTPLIEAADEGHEEVVKCLLMTGMVDIHVKNIRGQTALFLATFRGRTAVCELLHDAIKEKEAKQTLPAWRWKRDKKQ